MDWFIFLVILFIVLAAITAKLKSPGQRSREYPYTKNKGLFSPAERSFLGVLEQALGAEYRIFGKVRVADVVTVKSMSDRSAWRRAFNRISAKHFDFVLCTKDDLAIVAAIELDDKSHQQRKRQERDNFLVGVCAAATLPLIQVSAQRAYSVQEVRAQVLSVLGAQNESIPAPPQPLPVLETAVQAKTTPEPVQSAAAPQPLAKAAAPVCPKCAAPMVRRVAKSGANAGQIFWGCSAYPRCRTIIPVKA